MKKLFLTILMAIIGVGVFAQDNTNNGNNQQQNQPKQVQPDMAKDTVVLFMGRPGGPIKAADVAKGDSLWVNKGELQIVGFSLVYKVDTSMTKLDAKDKKLTPEMKTALKGLKEGSNFQFVNIRVQAKDGISRKPTYDIIEMFIEKTQ